MTALAEGQVVFASDRGNYGRVVCAPSGGVVVVHFRSPNGREATVTLPVSKLKAVGDNGSPGGAGAVIGDEAAEDAGGTGGIDRVLGAIDRMEGETGGRARAGAAARVAVAKAGVDEATVAEDDPAASPPPPEPVVFEMLSGEEPVPRGTRPCCRCKSRRFWRSVHGSVVCGTCHPPASPELVEEWIEIGGGE